MSVKCGNHNGQAVYHESAQEVRACYGAQAIDRINAKMAARPVTRNEQRVLDRLTGTDPADFASRERYRQMWAGDSATETTPVPAPTPVGDATEKQVSYVRSLLSGRVAPESFRAYADEIASAVEAGSLMKRDASRAIEKMNGWVRAPRSYTIDASGQGVTDPPQALADEDGIYRDPATGRIFKVQYNRASGDGRALYAKRLMVDGSEIVPLTGARDAGREVDMSWVYAGGIAKAGVQKAWRMTREDAARFGQLYGVCVRCGRDLTLEESIDRAMGATCAGKMGW